MEHFLTVVEEGSVYSCGAGSLCLSTLDSILHIPLAKRARTEEELEVEIVEEGGNRASPIFFQIVLNRPSKKTLHIPVSAGGRASIKSTIIMVRPLLHQLSPDEVILGDAQDVAPSEMTIVLEAIKGSDLETPPIWRWNAKSLAWYAPGEVQNSAHRTIMSRLVNCGAVPSAHVGLPTDAIHDPDETAAANALLANGHISQQNASGREGFFLTHAALQSIQCSNLMSTPQNIFSMAADKPPETCTAYELITMLADSGWTWEPRLSMAQSRRRGTPPQPAGSREAPSPTVFSLFVCECSGCFRQYSLPKQDLPTNFAHGIQRLLF